MEDSSAPDEMPSFVERVGIRHYRNNMSEVNRQVELTGKPVVLTKDNTPAVAIIAYEDLETVIDTISAAIKKRLMEALGEVAEG